MSCFLAIVIVMVLVVGICAHSNAMSTLNIHRKLMRKIGPIVATGLLTVTNGHDATALDKYAPNSIHLVTAANSHREKFDDSEEITANPQLDINSLLSMRSAFVITITPLMPFFLKSLYCCVTFHLEIQRWLQHGLYH